MGRVSTCQKKCKTIDLRGAQVNHVRRNENDVIQTWDYYRLSSDVCFVIGCKSRFQKKSHPRIQRWTFFQDNYGIEYVVATATIYM